MFSRPSGRSDSVLSVSFWRIWSKLTEAQNLKKSSTQNLMHWVTSNWKWKIFSNFVSFSECPYVKRNIMLYSNSSMLVMPLILSRLNFWLFFVRLVLILADITWRFVSQNSLLLFLHVNLTNKSQFLVNLIVR